MNPVEDQVDPPTLLKDRLEDARVLIVDDELINVRVLEAVVKKNGFKNLKGLTNSTLVTGVFSEFRPDIILLDLMMPEMDGFEVMAQLKTAISGAEFLPILVLTADATQDTKHRALASGASDFVTKPFDAIEVTLRVRNLLQMRAQHQLVQHQKHLLEDQNRILEEKVFERTKDLELAQAEIVQRLAKANEFRDDHTGGHIQRVGCLAAAVANQLGLPPRHVGMIAQAATLHDLGKIGIADDILLKPAKLTDPEFVAMKSHTTRGGALLSGGHSAVIQMAESIALSHHERWDGNGYPVGIKGDEIPIEGRIVAVVDVLDALTHDRPYKKAWSLEDALHEIQRLSGSHFDPAVVEALIALPIHVLLGMEAPEAIQPPIKFALL